MRFTSPSFLAVLALASACAKTTPVAPPRPATLLPISAEDLRRDLFAFSDDSMGGRETATPYATKAARFLAARLITMGLEPAGDSLYFQRVPLIKDTFTPETRFQVAQGQSTVPLALGTDVAPLMSLGEGTPLPKWNWSATI